MLFYDSSNKKNFGHGVSFLIFRIYSHLSFGELRGQKGTCEPLHPHDIYWAMHRIHAGRRLWRPLRRGRGHAYYYRLYAIS